MLTLHGPSGPRRGAAMNELSVIHDGALLLRNGVIEEAGPARRVENLAASRTAREVDAAGRLVMPAFVDPDGVLVYPQPAGKHSAQESSAAVRIAVLSKHRLTAAAIGASSEYARHGTLSIGAHTSSSSDLRNTVRTLRIHQALQGKPLRIRSVLAPPAEQYSQAGSPILSVKWLADIRDSKLASILELSLREGRHEGTGLRHAASAAAEAGFAIRIRLVGADVAMAMNLACASGPVAVIAPPLEFLEQMRIPANAGCVHVLLVTDYLRGEWPGEARVRDEIDAGIPVALASGFRTGGPASLNPQYHLQLAVEKFGMSQEEAIVATTYNAACALRMSQATGSLEPGKAADFIVMDVPDYRDLFHRAGHSDVLLAMRAGNQVYRRGALTAD